MVGKPMISQRPWGLFNVPKNLFWTRVIKNITYKAGNIPLGERKDSDIFKVTIPDARIISANGIDCQPILLLEKQCILIGTGSPQRFIDYEELLKCWE